MEKLFPLLVAALEVFHWYGLQDVRYTPGQTVNQVFFYKDFLERLRKRVICMRPDIVDKWMLHHDNASCHTALLVTEFFTSKGFPMIPQLPSPVLGPCDFFLFPKLKNVLKERHSVTLEDIQKTVMDILKTIPFEDFQRCYQKWDQCLHRYVAAQGNYFERDDIDV